jgi:hypothetical protein
MSRVFKSISCLKINLSAFFTFFVIEKWIKNIKDNRKYKNSIIKIIKGMKNLGNIIKNYLVNLYKYIMYFESEITKILKSN